MSLSKISLLAALLAGCGTSVSAEELLPAYVRQSADTGPVAQRSLAAGLSARAADVEPADYLAQAADVEPADYLAQAVAVAPDRVIALTGVALPSGRWSPSLAPAAVAGQEEFYNLIDALNALGPIGVSVADYLALALPGLDNSRDIRSGPPPVDASRARDHWRPAQFVVSVPLATVAPTAKAAPESAKPWALPAALSDQLTRYLMAAAALALLAGAGLRLAALKRRNAAPSLARR